MQVLGACPNAQVCLSRCDACRPVHHTLHVSASAHACWSHIPFAVPGVITHAHVGCLYMHEQCTIQLQLSRGRKSRSPVQQQRSCMSNECEASSTSGSANISPAAKRSRVSAKKAVNTLETLVEKRETKQEAILRAWIMEELKDPENLK
eukprot:434239-Lingulodinium_polyedra.AAC.1